MKLRVLENFAGIGTQRMALNNLGIDHEVVGITEIDKFAIKSYEAIHGEVNNLGDISLVDPNDVPDHDLFTYSFPCQDISVAGKGKGFEKGAGTRSGLLWECEKVIRAKKPKYLLMENVKNLVSKKFKPGFEEWLQALEEFGYSNYYSVLNAKDYGIPQNRERVFCVSILGEHEPYKFPEKETLELRLKDILEHEVDEKFYLDNDKAKQLIATVSEKYDIKETTPTDGGLREPKPKEVANTILARYDAGISNQQSSGTMVIEPNVLTQKRTEYGKAIRKDYEKGLINESRRNMTEMRPRVDGVSNTLTTVLKDNYVVEPKAERIGGIFDKDSERHQAGAVWDKEQLAPTLDTMQGGWRQPSVFIKNNTKQGYVEATDGDGVDLAFPSSNTRRGRVQKGKSQTLDTSDSKGVVENLRIRKLTPKECWRLMGISDEDFEKAQGVNSNTQLYKQAGNAIVVDVLEAIFTNMFK